jgi:hypothetical protein
MDGDRSDRSPSRACVFLPDGALRRPGHVPDKRPDAGSAALVVLTGFGFWSALFAKGNVWYRRITIAILLVSGSIIFFKMYDPKDKIERIEAAQEAYRAQLIDEALTPILRKAEHGVKLTADEAQVLEKAKSREEKNSLLSKIPNPLAEKYRKVIVQPLTSYRDQQICGIKKVGYGNGSSKKSTRQTQLMSQEIP